MLNYQVLEELHQVRNRQIPWHKNAARFAALRVLGLIERGREKRPVASSRIGAEIAVLSALGRSEFERLRRCELEADWDRYQRAGYGT